MGTLITKEGLNFSKPGVYDSDDGIKADSLIVVRAEAVSSNTELAGAKRWEHTFPGRPHSSLEDGDEFNDASPLPNKGWSVYDNTGQRHSAKTNTIYTKDAVSVKDGNLEIRTARHCLKPGQEPTKETESPGGAVCPAGKRTMYTSGRIETDFLYNAPFEMEVRARMADGQDDGLHFAAWLVNNQPYCHKGIKSSYLGEIDTMELLSERAHTTNTTHVTCTEAESGAGTVRDGHRIYTKVAGEWHTHRMTWDGYSVKYYLNGKLVPSDRGDTPETTAQSLGMSPEKIPEGADGFSLPSDY